MKTGKRHTLLSIVLLGALLLGASFTVHAACISDPNTPGYNRDLKAGCGYDIILVLDESGSIAGATSPYVNHRADVVEGARSLLKAFKNTGSRVALLEFATNVRAVQLPGGPLPGTYLDVTDANMHIFESYLVPGNAPITCIGNLSPSNYSPHYSSTCQDPGPAVQSIAGYTNWQTSLEMAWSIHDGTAPAQGPATLVVFLTDGNPTTHNQFCTSGDLGCAITAANSLKSSDPGGSGENYPHLFVVAVGGDVRVNNIRDISGCDELPATPTTLQVRAADYTQVPFSGLEKVFREIAFASCGSSVNVTKLIDPDGPEWPAPAVVAPNIEFEVDVFMQGHVEDDYEWLTPEKASSCPTPETGKGCPGPGPASTVGKIQNAWTSATGVLNYDWAPHTADDPQNWEASFSIKEKFPADSTLVYREMSCFRETLDLVTGDVTETLFTCRRSRTVPLLPDQPSPPCLDYDSGANCVDLVDCVDIDVDGDGVGIIVSANDILNCQVINDDVSRLPVTLNHFSSTLAGESIEFRWDTLSETDMLGFRLWAVVEGQRVTLGERLVLSNSSTSATPQSYTARRSVTDLVAPPEAVGITSVDIGGAEQDFGPYNIGETFGEQVEPNAIDWQTINSSVDEEMEKAGYTKSGKRWVRQGAAPASGDPGVGNAEIME